MKVKRKTELIKGLGRSISGFTLIELTVVIAILGILAVIAVPIFMGFQESAKAATFISNINTMEKIIYYYSLSRDDGPDTEPNQPGQMTDAEWNQYAKDHLDDFIVGEWPTNTPWGGYYTYRAYPQNWSHINNWKRVDYPDQTISQVVGNGPFEIIMIRFVNPSDEEGFNKALEALKDSKYGNRVYRYSNEYNIGIPVVFD